MEVAVNHLFLILYIVGPILSLLVLAFVLRWIFRIERQIWIFEKQLDILITIAMKHGVEKEVIQEVLDRK